MKKLLIADASTAQLRTFAKDVQQLDKVPTDRAGILAALTEAGYTQDHIFVAGDEAPAASTVSEQPVDVLDDQLIEVGEKPTEMPSNGFAFWTKAENGKPPCPMVTLRINETERNGGKEPAHPVINNSPPLVIQRNVLVRIPYDFYLVLRQAGGTAIRHVEEEGKMKPVEVRSNYSEYPLSDVVLPRKSEVEAWIAWTSQHELGRPKAAVA